MIVPACNSFSWTKETRDRTHVCRVTIPGWIPFHHPKYLFVLWRICTCYRLDRATQSRNLQGCAHAGLVWSSPHVLSGTSTCTQPVTHPPSPPPRELLRWHISIWPLVRVRPSDQNSESSPRPFGLRLPLEVNFFFFLVNFYFPSCACRMIPKHCDWNKPRNVLSPFSWVLVIHQLVTVSITLAFLPDSGGSMAAEPKKKP